MLTPLDIQNKKFKTSPLGYQKDEVEDFLELVLNDYESLYKDSIDLHDKINALNNALEHYKSIEDTMQNTLIVAQSTGEDVKRNAEERARMTLEDAEKQAQAIIENANRSVSTLTAQAENLKQSMELFKSRMIGMLTAQMDAVKGMTDHTEL